jgi:twitching motility protein PilT
MSDLPEPIAALLAALENAGATDLLICAGTPPRLRVDGNLTVVPGHAPLTPEETETLVRGLLADDQWERFREGGEVDFAFSWAGRARFRGNAYHQRGSMAVALRHVPWDIPTFEKLGLPESVRAFARLNQGLVLVTGPTGSGKSTTLAAMIDWINENRAVHILTIEDPIEYLHQHKTALVSQREVGPDTQTFLNALRNALREDPDVILVGEMRDLESIAFAITLAETGHLVFGTLHTNDTAQAVDRVVDVFPSDHQAQIRTQLAAVLSGIVYQRLMPRIGGGVVAAHEVLVVTAPVRNLIKEGKTNQIRNQLITGQRDGMQTFEMSLNRLLTAGTVTYDEAVARSLFPKDVARA